MDTSDIGFAFIILFISISTVDAQTSASKTVSSKKYNTKCVIDKALPASALNNYMNCTKSGKTTGLKDCCLINNKVNCCNKSENIVKLILYVTAILVTSLVLAIICLIVYWSDTWPWVGRLKQRCCKCCPKKKNSEKEKLKSEEMASQHQLKSTPDDFWAAPQGQF